jgi:hypothetical protein
MSTQRQTGTDRLHRHPKHSNLVTYVTKAGIMILNVLHMNFNTEIAIVLIEGMLFLDRSASQCYSRPNVV